MFRQWNNPQYFPHSYYCCCACEGWREIERLSRAASGEQDEDAEPEAVLPPLAEGQTFDNPAAEISERYTQPPKAFTEDTLLSAMESAGKEDTPEDAERKGLGTTATRAGIIEKLISAGFAERKGKKLIPTKDGYNLVAILPDSLTSPQLTAEWETRLTGIAKGSDSPADFMRGIEEMTAGLVKTYSAISEDKAKLFTPQREAIGTCPRCGAAVYEGKKNFYCSDRACSFVMWKNDRFFEQRKKAFTKAITIDRVNYELVYTAPLTKDMTLGDIWERFNIDHPADFKGHSLSVSDIVVLHQNDEDTAHYVDSIGFQQVPEFLQEQQTPVFDKLPPEQQQALSDTVQDTLQMLVDADKRIYGDVTGKTLEAIAAQGYSYKDGQLEKQQPEATPDSLLTGETVRTPRGNFHITDMSREQIEAAGFGFHHASEDGKYLIMGNGTQAYAIAAEQPQRDNPLKHVEDTIEQNDNNFDGLINNTPQTPTVADFEQRAKAGEAISVTDLAKAVKAEKREQPQKKPSILKKLDEYKKQAAQQPKDKQKEHKKDLEV